MTFTEWLTYFDLHGMTLETLRQMSYEFNARDPDVVPCEVRHWIADAFELLALEAVSHD